MSPLNNKVPDLNPTDPLSWALGLLVLEQPNDWDNIKKKNWKKSYLYIINIIQQNVIFSECYVRENKQIRAFSS